MKNNELKNELLRVLKETGSSMDADGIQSYSALFSKYSLDELSVALHELYKAGKVSEHIKYGSGFGVYYSFNTLELKKSKEQSQPWIEQVLSLDNSAGDISLLKKHWTELYEAENSTECEKWAAEVMLSLSDIDKRKDNTRYIDYPLRDMINQDMIGEICDLFESNRAIRMIYFTKCYYWPVLRDIMIYLACEKMSVFEDALNLYENNMTVLSDKYGVGYVKDRALLEREKHIRNIRYSIETEMEQLAENEDYTSDLLDCFLNKFLPLSDLTVEDVLYEWIKIHDIAGNRIPRKEDSFLNETAYIFDQIRKKYSEDEVNEAIFDSFKFTGVFFRTISSIKKAKELLQWAEDHDCDVEIYNVRDGLKINPHFSMKEKNDVWNSSRILLDWDEQLFLFTSLDEIENEKDYASEECDVCHRKLERIKAKILMNDEEGNAVSAFVQEVGYCPMCDKCFVSVGDEEEIEKKLFRMKNSYLTEDEELYEYMKDDEDCYLLTSVWESTMPSIDSDIVVNIEDQNFYHYEENGHKSFVDHKAEYPWPVMPDVYSTDYFDDKCAICKSPLSVSRANLVIRDTDGDYEGTFVQFVHWCPNCRKYYFTDEDNTRIANEFLRMKQGQILLDVDKEDAEAGDSIIHHDRGYLDLPVLETDIRIDLSKHNLNIVSNKTIDAMKELKETLETLEDMREKYGIVSQIGDLKDQSFLGMMGYSTGESLESRHRILEKAVRIHGKRRVIDHLQYLINTRSGSVERDYSNAIRIWKSDIEYVIACE